MRVGQSNGAFGAGVGPPPLQRTNYPNDVLALAEADGSSWTEWYGRSAEEGGPAAIARFDRLAAAEHPQTNGLSPTIMTAEAMMALAVASARPLPPQICFTSWRGDTAAHTFAPGFGLHLYENSIAGALSARIAAKVYGHDLPSARILWTQGEGGPFVDYARTLSAIIDDYRQGVRDTLHLDALPPFYLNQINQPHNAGATGVELDQRQIAIERAADGVTMIGPMYQLPLLDETEVAGVATNVHIDNIGRVMLGELEAVAMMADDFRAVGMEVAVQRDGRTIRLAYGDLPGSGRLEIDNDWVASVPTLGFRALRIEDQAPLGIAAVAVDGADVVLTLAEDPGEPIRIDYARNTGNPMPTWAGGRGLLFVDSGVASPIAAAMGAPPTIRHYALRTSHVVD